MAGKQAVEDELAVSVALAERSSPFGTAGVLTAYVRPRLEERTGGD